MNKYQVTVRSPALNKVNIKTVNAMAHCSIDATCKVLHMIGDLSGNSFTVSVKAVKECKHA